MASDKLVIEVVAGIVPDTPDPELTRRWHWSTEDQAALASPNLASRRSAETKYISMHGESREYAASLENPSRAHWVRRDWIWL